MRQEWVYHSMYTRPRRQGKADHTRAVSLLQHKLGDDIVKSFTLDMVELIHNASYDGESGEVTSLMDAYISKVVAADPEFNLEQKKDQKEQNTMDTSKADT